MANFLHHESCPNCGSRDNLGRYNDGSAYCFGCGYQERPQGVERLKTFLKEKIEKFKVDTLDFPEDFELAIPDKARVWLDKYGITQHEISFYKIGYSPLRELLIFPIKDVDGEIIMWQGRYFGNNSDYPKYITKGSKDFVLVYDSLAKEKKFSSDTVVLVEDLISAIRVSRVLPCCAILGATIPLQLTTRLSKTFKQAIIWLDDDKWSEGCKQAMNLSIVFENGTQVRHSLLDPKCYSQDQIKTILGVK